MTKKYLALSLILLGISAALGFKYDTDTQEDCKTFTIYLVRHAEKDLTSDSGGDPPLTECGEQRAEHLSSFLSHVPLDAIYSTNYARTKNTAMPTARSKELEVQEYAPQDLGSLAELLMDRKQDALVVGHSNTTGVLAGMLVGEDIGEFDLNIYNRVYQVVIHQKSGRLHLFHTAFSCGD